jgi:hypothetical protein
MQSGVKRRSGAVSAWNGVSHQQRTALLLPESWPGHGVERHMPAVDRRVFGTWQWRITWVDSGYAVRGKRMASHG